MVFTAVRLTLLLRRRRIRNFAILLLLLFALFNFFFLITFQTSAHQTKENLLQSVFALHVHRNPSSIEISGKNERHRALPSWGTSFMGLVTTSANTKNDGKRTTESKTVPSHVLRAENTFLKSDLVKDQPSHLNTLSEERSQANTLTSHPTICTSWCTRGNDLKPPYFLTAVLLVRIYRYDLAKLTSREMIQWLQYLRYAGFQHVYVYDAYVLPSESQRDVIRPFVQSGYATYIDWSAHNPYTIRGTQVAAYQHCLDFFGKESKWQAAIDIDEYPFSPSDLGENFMSRFLTEYSAKNPHVSEITMKNYLFLGKPIDDAIEPFLIARIRRRTHRPANALVKPIYKPENIGSAQVHHNGVRTGSSRDSPDALLRMNHYWGARLQNWGNDTPKVLDITEVDYTIQPIVKRLKFCADCLGWEDLIVKRWE